MKSKQVIVLVKNGAYYCKHPDCYSDTHWNEMRINGKDVSSLRNPLWTKINEMPRQIERLVTPGPRTVAYKLKEEFMALDLPRTVKPDYFAYFGEHDVCDHAGHQPLYESVTETPESYWEAVDWNIVVADLDCEPVEMRLPVKVSFPACVEQYPECHHKYPCSIGGNAVFDVLHSRIEAVVRVSKNLSMSDFSNIRCLTVWMSVDLPKPVIEEYEPLTFGKRKPKKQKRTVYRKKIEILDIHGPSYNTPGKHGYVPGFEGNDYAELEKKVEAYIESVVRILDDRSWQICERCDGQGLRLIYPLNPEDGSSTQLE